ncbi:formin-J-like isoform X2 [Biomphalaria glabrata]
MEPMTSRRVLGAQLGSISVSSEMVRKKGTPGRNRNVFKGTVLVSILVESHPKLFTDRASACELGRKLFREGHIRSIFGANVFEDSAQLYVWTEDCGNKNEGSHTMTGSNENINSGSNSTPSHRKAEYQLIEEIKEKVLNRSEAYNIVTSYNSFFQELEQDFGLSAGSRSQYSSGSDGQVGQSSQTPYTSTLEHKKSHIYSTDSSLEAQSSSRQPRDAAKTQEQKLPSRGQFHEKDISPESASAISLNHSPSQQSTIKKDTHTSEHPLMGQDPLSSGRLSSFQHKRFQSRTNPQSGGKMIPEEIASSSKDSQMNTVSPVAAIDYDTGSNQQSTLSSQMSSLAPESLDHNIVSHSSSSDPALPRNTEVYPQKQNQSPGTRWVDSNLASTSELSQSSSGKPVAKEEVPPKRALWGDNDGFERSRPWPENTYSYSDNEKQLLEEMRRMKKEHQTTLRTYESRINKLMAKMHELRNIAEMLENSSSKSSPYGVLPGKLALLNILADKDLDVKKLTPVSEVEQVPPPLPPRPGRGTRVYPNKPIMHTGVSLRPLPWSRIILEENGELTNTIWHGMIEPKFDTGELERMFSGIENSKADKSLYDDICMLRGRTKSLVSMYDTERCQRMISEMKSLHCSLADIVQAFTTLDCSDLHIDSFAELLELLSSQKELDKIQHHVRRKGAGQLEAPDYLVCELSKVEHYRERLEFLRFKNKLQINLFEIDQQLRELHTACDEITTSLSLKHVLETVLSIGNYMNAGTERGQADGFKIDVLNSLKEMQDLSKHGNLLDLIMRTYCLIFESDMDFGCPTKFHLPEPSNMRHAAQVSFEDIQRALKELKEELFFVKNNLDSLSKREGNAMTLKITSDNFLTSALEGLAEEQKLMEKTQVHFLKTASYFSHENQRSSPQEFFQIWASFLHDCKYYWKLAHRNLAKVKFNAELATKSQMSTSSVAGVHKLKSVIVQQMQISQDDSELQSSKAQQMQHINSWIESIGKYAGHMEVESFVNIQPEDSHQGPDYFPKQSRAGKSSGVEGTSPPYINQASHVDKTNPFHSNQGRHGARDIKPSDAYNGRESPKPMKATPPNVIKPKPLVQASPTSSPSPSATHLTQPLSLVPYQQQFPVDNNNNRNKQSHKEDSSLEPLYESLPSEHKGKNQSLTQYPPVSDASSFSPSLHSPESEQNQKKNSKFFKALLKRDHHKKSPDDIPTSSQSPSKHGLVQAPKHKLRTTLLNKISGSGQSKKAGGDSQRTQPSTDEKDSPPKPSRSFQHDLHLAAPALSSRETESTINEEKIINNYYNYVPPEISKSSEMPPPLPYRPENLHEIASSQDDNNDHYKTDSQDNRAGIHQPNQPSQNRKTNAISDSAHSGKIRSRAPIALGSNMSISDAYNKLDSGQPSLFSQPYLQVPSMGGKEKSESSSSNTLTGASGSYDSKWVKANPVPVYKAKLIPNYENQTKLDPRLDVGVRGQAEPAVPAMQDYYRKELQKKSEQYVGVGSHPAPGLQNLGLPENNANRDQNYSDMSVRGSQFHASPVILAKDSMPSSNSHENNSNYKQTTAFSHQMINSSSQNMKIYPEYSERLGPSHTHKEHGRANWEDGDFIKKPPGWRASEKSTNIYPEEGNRKHQERKSQRSSSAHNMLDRDYETSKPMRQAQSAEMDGPRGRVSRRDMMDKKMTPTSHRDQGDVKPSVTSLIDRFEKKPDGLQPGLLDDDKPPSMTSTPVARRKTHNNNSAFNDRPLANNRAFSEGRSRSTGRDLDNQRNTHERTENQHQSSHQSMPHHPQMQHSSKSPHQAVQSSHPSMPHHPQMQHSSKSPHQAVAPFLVHPSSSGFSQSSVNHQQKRTDGYSINDWRSKNGSNYPESVDLWHQSYNPSVGHNQRDNLSTSVNAKSIQSVDQSANAFNNQTSSKERGNHFHDKASSDRSRTSKSSSHNFQTPQNNQSAGTSLSSQPYPQFSNVLHKPEPLYPNAQQDSHSPQHNYDQHSSARPLTNNQPGAMDLQPHHRSPFSNYNSIPQQQLSSYSSQSTSHQQQNYNSPTNNPSVTPYNNNNILSHNNNNKLGQTSAFERPLKPGSSYTRQPGALAVVKPTVLHL